MGIPNLKDKLDTTCQEACASAQALAVTGKAALRRRAEAADTVEYVLMAAIFCLGICAVAFVLRNQVTEVFNQISNNLANATGK